MLITDIQDSKVKTTLEQIARRGDNVKPIMATIGNLAVKSIQKNFDEQGRPDKWLPSKGKIQGRTLVRTGTLRDGIHYVPDNEGVTVMTTKLPYARILHFGGTTEPHEIRPRTKKALRFTIGGVTLMRRVVHHPGSKLPARPYMLLQDEDIANIERIALDYVAEQDKLEDLIR